MILQSKHNLTKEEVEDQFLRLKELYDYDLRVMPSPSFAGYKVLIQPKHIGYKCRNKNMDEINIEILQGIERLKSMSTYIDIEMRKGYYYEGSECSFFEVYMILHTQYIS